LSSFAKIVELNVSAQKWLDKYYPANGVCQRETEIINYGKTREKTIVLDISERVLEGTLNLSGFSNL